LIYPFRVQNRSSAAQGEDGLLLALEELLEANLTLQRVLQESAARTRGYLEKLRAGARAVDLVQAQPVERDRTEDNEAIEWFTRARQRSRMAAFGRLGDEGMSRKEMAGRWGFSQQMVSRIVNRSDTAVE
jgi:hypothetical protein